MVKELNIVEEGDGDQYSEPVSPTGQYFNSSVLSISILAVFDLEIPIDDISIFAFLKDVFLHIHPRFSSLMVKDDNGVKQWKKVEVKLEDHVNIPIFPSGLSPECYDNHLSDYMSKITMEQLPHNRPLWDIHIIKYPTTNAAANLIFKLHHALGDGYSLMGAVFSRLQRADNPSVPLTLPSRGYSTNPNQSVKMNNNILRNIPKVLWSVFNTVSDFGWSLLKSSYVEDDKSLIRSGDPGVDFKPVIVSTMTFSLDHIKQIKTKLGVTVNDVITGTIFLGTRLYMKGTTVKGSNKLNNEGSSTAIVLFNTRAIREYKSVEKAWGNQFGFLHIPIPELTDFKSCNSLDFVRKAHKLIQRKRNSGAVFMTARLLECIRKYRGPEATAKYIRSSINNSSMAISNMIGPVERMALANHPVKSFYFTWTGAPLSLTITMISYMGKLRVVVGTEKGYIDPPKFKSSIENAFEMILKAAQEIA